MKTIKNKTKTEYKFQVNGEFVSAGTKSLDTKNRICLGSRVAKYVSRQGKVDAYEMFESDEGDILLRPTVHIPAREAWIYENPSVLAKIRQGLNEAKGGKLQKTKDVDKFIKEL